MIRATLLRAARGVVLAMLFSVPVQIVLAQVAAVPSVMNFQGRLTKPDGTPVADGTYSVRFSLHDAVTGGNEKWNQTLNVTAHNGTFAVLLSAFPTGTFNGNLWLEVKIGTDAPLTPRQQLVSVAYAMKASSVSDNAINSASIANGSITAADLASNTLNPLAWLLGGNSGTSASHFLGTTDNQALVFKANNQRGLQIQYVLNGAYLGNNLIGGYWLNSVTSGVTGATIFGGLNASADYSNRVTDHGGTVSGGGNNRAGNNNATLTDALYATVGGGFQNIATGGSSVIGGGERNTASGNSSTVGGGNTNTTSGTYATVPGGLSNTAAGTLSFAAGRQAKANHNGTFIWADSTVADFISTAVNQFLIRAGGGVGINKNNPIAGSLDVAGNGFFSGNIGVGTTSPLQTLDVNGRIHVAQGVIQQGGSPITSTVDLGLYSRTAGQWMRFVTTNAPFQWYSDGGAGTTPMMTLTAAGNLGLGTSAPAVKLDVRGTIRSNVVEIVGGSDVAEPYNVAPAGDIQAVPGMLVCIDEEKVGQMKVAVGAYNTTVAGVISGANGINPGITLRQKGTVADGELPVASVGRVWCYCDANANGAIKAGDMLTTSDTPGYAMKVTDFQRANGAVIGKAMSGLKSGKGLVLMLVSLK